MHMDLCCSRAPHGHEPTCHNAPSELHVVFDGPPGPEGCRFVELENARGEGISAGEWRERPDGLWALVLPGPPKLPAVSGADATRILPMPDLEKLAREVLEEIELNGSPSHAVMFSRDLATKVIEAEEKRRQLGAWAEETVKAIQAAGFDAHICAAGVPLVRSPKTINEKVRFLKLVLPRGGERRIYAEGVVIAPGGWPR